MNVFARKTSSKLSFDCKDDTFDFLDLQSSKTCSFPQQSDANQNRKEELAQRLSMTFGDRALSINEVSRLPDPVVDCLSMLLDERNDQMKRVSFFSERLGSLRSEAEIQHRLKEGLKSKLDHEKDLRITTENKFEAYKATHKQEKTRWSEERAEMNSQLLKMHQKDEAQTMLINRKEKELNRLQTNLMQKTVKDIARSSSSRDSKSKSSRQVGTTGKFPSTMSKETILLAQNSKSESVRSQSAEKENAILRKTLQSLIPEFVKLRQYQLKHTEIEIDRESAALVDSAVEKNAREILIEAMPAEWLAEQIGEVMGNAIVKMQKSLRDFIQISCSTKPTVAITSSISIEAYTQDKHMDKTLYNIPHLDYTTSTASSCQTSLV
jgi:hypothetical protein